MNQLESKYKQLRDKLSTFKYPRLQRPLYKESPFQEAKRMTARQDKSQKISHPTKKPRETNLILDKVRRCQEVLQGIQSARMLPQKNEEIRCDDKIQTKSVSPGPEHTPYSKGLLKKSTHDQLKFDVPLKKMIYSKSTQNFQRRPNHRLPQIQIKKPVQMPDICVSEIDKSTCSVRPLLSIPRLDRSASKSSTHSTNSSDSKEKTQVSFHRPSFFSKSNESLELIKKRSTSPLIPLSKEVPLECSKQREMREVKNNYYDTTKPLTKKTSWNAQSSPDKFPDIKKQNVLSRGYSLEREIKDIRQINMMMDKPLYPPKVKPSKVFNELRSAWI